MNPFPLASALFVGQPHTITDARGVWTSSIFRRRVRGPIPVAKQGLAGDRVAQPYHGGPHAALCVHLEDHYRFWNEHHDMALCAGNVGENVTLQGITEEEINAGDIIRLGTALLQVSGPRVPCANLARRIGRPDWVRLTIGHNRTGFYMRVLEPGKVQAGDCWERRQRLNEGGSIPAINRCLYTDFHPQCAAGILQMDGLDDWWKLQVLEKLRTPTEHWTAKITQ